MEKIKTVKDINDFISKTINDIKEGNYSNLNAEIEGMDLNKVIEVGKIKDNYTNTIDISSYEQKMNEILSKSKTKREKVANLAIFLSSEFPKLPYSMAFESGHDGSSLLGLSWTKLHTLDCSGFANWCLENAGIKHPGDYGITTDYENLVGLENKESIVSNSILENTKPGDFAYINNPERDRDHMGVVIDVKKDTHELVIAHESGSGEGMNITTISTDTGKITADDTGSSGINRTGEDLYFEHVLHMKYEDE